MRGRVCMGLLLVQVAAFAAAATVDPAAGDGLAATRTAGVPRVIIALWDSKVENRWQRTVLHQLAEMPLNHLGLIVEPHDINVALPDLGARADIRGVITWFQTSAMAAPGPYLKWAAQVVDGGKRYVALGDWGFLADQQGRNTPLEEVNAFLIRLGLEDEGRWHAFPYGVRPLVADRLIGFESGVGPAPPAFTEFRRISNTVVNHLSVGDDRHGVMADLVVTGPAGGYSAGGYSHYEDDAPHRRWIIDPFEFFRLAFGTDDLPKPDVTTLVGRRIYYSQIDGDGWRNASLAAGAPLGATTGEVLPRSIETLINETIRPYPDLPVTVAPIAADLDPSWCGDARAQRAAREVFALPQVEAGSHTYSHPLDWPFFASYTEERERPFERYSLHCHADHWVTLLWRAAAPGSRGDTQSELEAGSQEAHSPDRPRRSYADHPFSLDQEITGAARYIEQFLPAGKRVSVIQWSGNSLPFGEAIRRAQRAGLPALNGGDTRFDPEFPSVAWVAPVGRWDDGEFQIYASSSNENTYTSNWSTRYYGYKYLPRTLESTENPRRLKPIDIYYHAFSGDRPSSVAAVKEILRWVETQEITPIRTSLYARIAQGFYSTQIIPVGERAWRIEGRGALQTIRLDDAAHEELDWDRSTGVLGIRRANGSLYVALDPDIAAPIVALGSAGSVVRAPALVHSRWLIRSLRRDSSGFSAQFTATGFGPGEMLWRVPTGCSRWRWTVRQPARSAVSGEAQIRSASEIALTLGRLDGFSGAITLACAEQRG